MDSATLSARFSSTAAIMLTLFGWGAAAQSQEIESIRSGTVVFTVAEGEPVEIPRLHTEVSVKIDGSVAHVELRQRFRNPSDQWAEAIYAFPMPANARIERVSAAQDGKLLSHLRQAAPPSPASSVHQASLFRAPLADIAPHATVDITIAYLQNVEQGFNRRSLRVPVAMNSGRLPDLSLADDELDSGMAEEWVQIEHSANAATQTVSVQIVFDAALPLTSISSRHHTIQVASGEHTTILASSTRAPADCDFELEWSSTTTRRQGIEQARAFDGARLLPISTRGQ